MGSGGIEKREGEREWNGKERKAGMGQGWDKSPAWLS